MRLPRRTSRSRPRKTSCVVRSLGYAPATVCNLNNRTRFSHRENGFDSITTTSGVLVRAHRPGSSDIGSDRATLRRSWPDEVDDVSLLRCLTYWPAAFRLATIARPCQTGSCCLSDEDPDDHRDCPQDHRHWPRCHCAATESNQSAPQEGRGAVGTRLPRASQPQRAVEKRRSPAERPCSDREHLRQAGLRIH